MVCLLIEGIFYFVFNVLAVVKGGEGGGGRKMTAPLTQSEIFLDPMAANGCWRISSPFGP